MQIDFKITTWERVEIEDAFLEEIKSKLEDNTIYSANSLIEYCDKNNIDCTYEGVVLETDHQLTPEENNGEATIEILSDTGNTVGTIWKNVKL